LFTHANLMFTNECLGELEYEATTAGILMAGIFIAFSIEYLGHRLAAKFWSRNQYNDEVVSILVLEAGIIFHSICKFYLNSLLPPSSDASANTGM
jgi:solute carrier family 39 (zinc transporter), member 1/2/3